MICFLLPSLGHGKGEAAFHMTPHVVPGIASKVSLPNQVTSNPWITVLDAAIP